MRLIKRIWQPLWKGSAALIVGFELMLLAVGLWRAPGRAYLDFFTFLRSGMRVRSGQPLYVFDTVAAAGGGTVDMITLQHPAVAVLFAPLSLLPPTAAYALWVGLSMLAWSLAVFLTVRAATPPPSWRLPLALLAITAPGLHWDLMWGQLSCLVAQGRRRAGCCCASGAGWRRGLPWESWRS
ncbi:MAG: glycosyltransferase 87 family protein [Thermomicrobiales bacterium]